MRPEFTVPAIGSFRGPIGAVRRPLHFRDRPAGTLSHCPTAPFFPFPCGGALLCNDETASPSYCSCYGLYALFRKKLFNTLSVIEYRTTTSTFSYTVQCSSMPKKYKKVAQRGRNESYFASSIVNIVPSVAMLPIDKWFPHGYDISRPSSSDQGISNALQYSVSNTKNTKSAFRMMETELKTTGRVEEMGSPVWVEFEGDARAAEDRPTVCVDFTLNLFSFSVGG